MLQGQISNLTENKARLEQSLVNTENKLHQSELELEQATEGVCSNQPINGEPAKATRSAAESEHKLSEVHEKHRLEVSVSRLQPC